MTEKDLTEEVFCLKYELNTLASQVLKKESERWVPNFLYPGTEHSHIERYKLACKYTLDKEVIDIACGTGKGSYMIATEGQAKQVDGFDIESAAIRYSKWRNGRFNITYKIINAELFDITSKYDCAVSFETIEHLNNYRSFLSNVKKALKPGGLFLISTPISPLPVDKNPYNPYHIQEWGFTEFQNLVNEFFKIEKIYIQLYPTTQIPVEIVYDKRIKRLLKKITNKLSMIKSDTMKKTAPTLQNLYSQIEEFNDQYPVNKLGVTLHGYQIILAKK